MLRTQIYLPEELRNKINKYRGEESLSEYIRRAAQEKTEKDKKKKQDLEKLADEVTAGVKKSGWEGIDVIAWQREMRKDREV